MKYSKYLFIVSAIVMFSGIHANAVTVTGLATPNYVDGAINSLSDVARSGSYNDLSDKPNIPAAQVNSDWNATSGKAQILNKPTLGSLAAKNAVASADITDGTIVAADLASNAVTTVKITDKNVTKAKLEDSVQTSLGKADNSLQKAASATFTNGHVLKADASGNVVDGGALGTLATKDAVSSADITDGTIVNADIAATAAIATSKISGLDTALAGKQTTSNMVNLGADNKIAAGDSGSTTKYPSMKVAEQIAAAAAGDAVTAIAGDITALQNRLDDLANQVDEDKAALGTLAYKNAVGSADITDGSVAAADLASNSVTTAKIADSNVTTAKLAAGAVTAAKTSGVIGYIPSGSATATTYAQIWVQ